MGKCPHNIELSVRPAWQVCKECETERDNLIALRRDVVLTAFKSWIETGFWGDVDTGVGKLYFTIYRKNQR